MHRMLLNYIELSEEIAYVKYMPPTHDEEGLSIRKAESQNVLKVLGFWSA